MTKIVIRMYFSILKRYVDDQHSGFLGLVFTNSVKVCALNSPKVEHKTSDSSQSMRCYTDVNESALKELLHYAFLEIRPKRKRNTFFMFYGHERYFIFKCLPF